MSSHSLGHKVTDRQSFIEFLENFHRDLLNNKQEWENKTLEDFLEALTRYATDIPGYYNNTNQNINVDIPSWQVFADMLQGARTEWQHSIAPVKEVRYSVTLRTVREDALL